MIQAVIFDMDGLLIDSEPLWRKAEIRIFAQHDVFLTDNDCRSTTGLRVDEVVSFWMNQFNKMHLDAISLIKEINQGVIDLVNAEGEALPGVFEIMRFFRQKQIPMALASSSSQRIIDAVAKKLKLTDYLTHLISAEKLPYGKPHPEVFLETAKHLKISPLNCLVFEDSVFGVIAAKSARMKAIAVPESQNFQKPEFAIADKKLNSLTQFDEAIFFELNS